MTEEQIGDFVNECHDKESVHGFVALTGYEKTITLVSSVDYEIALGGFLGFFCNSAGDKAAETVEALETIGAASASEAVRRAVDLFPDSARIAERDYRQEHLMSLREEFRLLEPRFEEDNPCVWELLLAYVRSNGTERLAG